MTATARRMGLGALTDAIGPERVVGIPVGEVAALAYDSRRAAPGTLFFAVPGVHVDGHAFAARAVEQGAVAIVVERELAGLDVPQLVVDRTRRALADAADAWYGHPSERLQVIGITGTDGKTTSSFLAVELLRAGGMRPGMIGTVAADVGDERRPNDDRNTTPESLELQELLAEMVAAGNDGVVMEATSHGLALERTRNCRFDVGVLTTVSSEHLEFHGSLEAYHAAKALLFEEAPLAILNADEPTFDYFRAHSRDRVLTYGVEADADLRATDLAAGPDGTRFTLQAPEWRGSVHLPMPGAYNVYNGLAALTIAQAEGVDLALAADALGRTAGVPGRMERVDAGQPFAVVVDYAHTADSLAKVLRTLRPITRGRLIAVFGSAGERDPTKRPAMGRVAAELADLVIVTDEDPRLEHPRVINEAIAAGARAAGARDGESLEVIDDRRAAIGRAVEVAGEGDVILLAGKGHEESIFYGTAKLPWDDRQVAREALQAAGWPTSA
ncbi:MAG TPA: UDP-N-acetylmuramoyl-L-alanyl-D-glutamate--2,6-diaminopimelate ligase [Candidatus Limnocylindria bacterium]|nr:UDP-N-acetylmuramoyl-L-alanyl-D-glutamate--2,6-diaminopimelate ligase [Candidatus Limnocylindria bacterium]